VATRSALRALLDNNVASAVDILVVALACVEAGGDDSSRRAIVSRLRNLIDYMRDLSMMATNSGLSTHRCDSFFRHYFHLLAV
jgi:hypothetical protein